MRSLRCYEQGLALRDTKLPLEVHPLAGDPATAVLFEFLAAAVCHGTNWDRLRAGLLAVVRRAGAFSPTRLAALTKVEFCTEFGGAFTEVEDIPRRWEMFVTVATAFASGAYPFDGDALVSQQWRLSGPDGLHHAIDTLEPFRADPHRKKTRVLLQQLYRHGLLHLSDPEQLGPAIEHHIIRLYLRTGRVVRADKSILDYVDERATDVRNITALRAAVEQAMSYTAAAAELTVNEINEIEWQIGRSYCVRDGPRCDGPCRSDKPVDPAIAQLASGGCPFRAICDAPKYKTFARLTEPRLAKHHGYY